MSSEKTRAAFTIMRAAADGQITPNVAEAMAEKVCHPDKHSTIINPHITGKNVAVRFTGNRLIYTNPEEHD